MKKLYIECTQTWESRNHCGISRVVRNLIKEGIADKDIETIPFIIQNGTAVAVGLDDLVVEERKEFTRDSKLYDYCTNVYLAVMGVIGSVLPFPAVKRFIARPKSEFGLLYIVNLLLLIPARYIQRKLRSDSDSPASVPDQAQQEAPLLQNHLPRIIFNQGDHVLLPDCPWARGNKDFYKSLKTKGVILSMYCHDIIPISHPHYFFRHGASNSYKPWFTEMLEYFDSIVCVSEYTASRVRSYIEFLNRTKAELGDRVEPDIIVAGLGVKFDTIQDAEVCPEIKESIDQFSGKYYLMVGTIEVRKNHITVLNAFEMLWDNGIQCPLFIAGSWGWSVENFKERVASSKYLNKYLFVFNQVSDAGLVELYDSARTLLFPSHCEGYGLPLVEAAYHGLPILASDTKINREVAGNHATYFDVDDSFSLMKLVLDMERGLINETVHAAENIGWDESWKYLKLQLNALSEKISGE